MREKLDAKDFNTTVVPSRASRVETYLWDRGDDMSADIAAALYRADKPLQQTCVLIPVAAHQEADNIAPAIEAYANQQPLAPFSILMLLNHPRNADPKAVSATVTAVAQAAAKYPSLDIRSTLQAYDKPVIGQIRKDLWDAAARIALVEGTLQTGLEDVICINHDIDTVSMSPRYIRRVQARYMAAQTKLIKEELPTLSLEPRYTAVRHDYPLDTHPNASKVIFWNDFTSRLFAPNGCYEEGMVVPLSWYAQMGGINPNYKTHETRNLRPPAQRGIPGTIMTTSPRRYLSRLREDLTAPIWTEDSFGPNDACRQAELRVPDITFADVEERILDTFEDDMANIVWGRSNGALATAFDNVLIDVAYGSKTLQAAADELTVSLRAHVAPRIFLAKSVLRRVVGSEPLAELAEDVKDLILDDFCDGMKDEISTEIANRYQDAPLRTASIQSQR